MSLCGWVNVSGIRLADSRVARWLLTRMDGWMWTSLSRSFHSDWADSSVWDAVVIITSYTSDVRSNHSHWWIILSPPPAYDCLCFMLSSSQNVPLAVCVGAWGPLRCICQHEWTSSLFYNCILHWDLGSFFTNKWRKTSAEMEYHAALVHYKWFLSAGGYLLASVACSFLQQTAS